MLQVRQLALIESMTLTIDNGFTCLTGETGAGKSLLLDAVGLLLGARASVELVRQGADKAIVEGLFDWGGDLPVALRELLAKLGIEVEDEQLVITREVSANGKTVARVNGRMVTAQVLRRLGDLLVHQHGQHDSTLLLRREEHLGLLDAYGGGVVGSSLANYQSLYGTLEAARRTLATARRDDRDREQRIDLLRHQIAEIEAVRLKPGEEQRLLSMRGKMQHAERLHSVVDDVYVRVYEGAEREPAILNELHRLTDVVQTAVHYDSSLQELSEYIQVAQVNLTEAADFVRRYRGEFSFDPERLNKLEDRLAVIERILRKYGDTSEDVLRHLQEITIEVEQLERHDETIAELEAHFTRSQMATLAAAEELTTARKAVAVRLQQELASTLEGLLMPTVRFVLSFTTCSPSLQGCDEVEFLFSANHGEEPRPLAKIASGGELSRMMLAFIDVLSEQTFVPTLIFDEIDTGISGRAAQAVAERMRHLSQGRQVLCVTHVAQMASAATHHLSIEKRVSQGRTVTEVRRLELEERVDEVARMISGDKITATTRDHAREMIRSGVQS